MAKSRGTRQEGVEGTKPGVWNREWAVVGLYQGRDWSRRKAGIQTGTGRQRDSGSEIKWSSIKED